MIKSLAVLAALISGTFALADENSTVIDRKELFGKKIVDSQFRHHFGDAQPEESCTAALEKAELVSFAAKTGVSASRAIATAAEFGNREAYLHSTTRFQTPTDEGKTTEVDVADDSLPIESLIKILKNLRLQKDPYARTAIRGYAVHRFFKRIEDLRFRRGTFEIGEPEKYAEVLLLATPNIFANNPDPKLLLTDLTAHFYAYDLKFPKEDRYLFLTAILAGINLAQAISVSNGTFTMMILNWHKLYTHPGVSRTETSRAEDLVLQKLKFISDRNPELKERLADPPN
jgi:hypothetical protein